MDESRAFGDGAGEAADDAEPLDVPALAAWLAEQLSPEDLAAFVDQATLTAAERADDAVGAELTERLSYLP